MTLFVQNILGEWVNVADADKIIVKNYDRDAWAVDALFGIDGTGEGRRVEVLLSTPSTETECRKYAKRVAQTANKRKKK